MKTDKNIPTHVAVIMDGNGRWAQLRGHDRSYGHVKGVESVRSAIRSCVKHGVRYLTIYAFSTENWGRPKQEVDALMELFCKSVVNESDELCGNGISVKIIGDKNTLSSDVCQHLDMIADRTKDGDKLTLIIALNYSSRWEIAQAARKIAEQAAAGELETDRIDSDKFEQYLTTANYPDPDVIIRTGGEQRLSNFLLWQAAYSEFYFTDILWPDFDESCFDEALQAYAGRERKYGMITK